MSQKGSGSKSYKPPGAASRQAKRKRSHARLQAKKDRRVMKSSHGAFASVADLEKHRKMAT